MRHQCVTQARLHGFAPGAVVADLLQAEAAFGLRSRKARRCSSSRSSRATAPGGGAAPNSLSAFRLLGLGRVQRAHDRLRFPRRRPAGAGGRNGRRRDCARSAAARSREFRFGPVAALARYRSSRLQVSWNSSSASARWPGYPEQEAVQHRRDGAGRASPESEQVASGVSEHQFLVGLLGHPYQPKGTSNGRQTSQRKASRLPRYGHAPSATRRAGAGQWSEAGRRPEERRRGLSGRSLRGRHG